MRHFPASPKLAPAHAAAFLLAAKRARSPPGRKHELAGGHTDQTAGRQIRARPTCLRPISEARILLSPPTARRPRQHPRRAPVVRARRSAEPETCRPARASLRRSPSRRLAQVRSPACTAASPLTLARPPDQQAQAIRAHLRPAAPHPSPPLPQLACAQLPPALHTCTQRFHSHRRRANLDPLASRGQHKPRSTVALVQFGPVAQQDRASDS